MLGFLASRAGDPVNSDVLATTYGTSPVVLRRVLAKLQRAGLIETRRGLRGGSVLARDAKTIRLSEAYEAVVEDVTIFPRHPQEDPQSVGSIIGEYVNNLYAEAEQALLLRLKAVTVAEMDETLRDRVCAVIRGSTAKL